MHTRYINQGANHWQRPSPTNDWQRQMMFGKLEESPELLEIVRHERMMFPLTLFLSASFVAALVFTLEVLS